MVAAAFAATVAEPTLTSLGGGGFCLARTSAGEAVLFDFFVDTPGRGLAEPRPDPHFVPVTVQFPASEQSFNVGLGSAAVPGTLAGLVHVHQRLGRLGLGDVIGPAVGLAREGVVLNAHQAWLVDLLLPILTLTRAGRDVYAPGGRMRRAGDCLVNDDAAAFLESVAGDGGRRLYEGELAERVASDMVEGFGLLTAADLAAYRVEERSPLAVSYRGHQLLTNPRPSFGGSLVALALSLLERRDISSAGWGTAGHLEALASVMVEVEDQRQARAGTTHISVIDGEGNVASLSMSNGEGSGYLVPGTGIMLNNMLGEDDLHPGGFHAAPPGERVASMMAPAIVLLDDEPRLVLGSGGSKRIRTAILQVLSNVVDFGLEVARAVEAPRLHWDGELLQVEPGFDPAAMSALRHRWRVNAWDETNLYFGGVHAVTGSAGAGDPRRGGHARIVA